ncbi:MAG: V-type ATP synthase subunit E [Candidatus Hydrogenedentota bacterium]
MDVSPLLELMTQQAAKERQERLAQAQAEADRLRQEAEQNARSQRDEAVSQLNAELEAEAQRAREHARASAKTQVLAARDTLADDLLSEVRAQLARLADGPDFAPVLEALLDELLEHAPAEAIVLVPPAYEDQVLNWLTHRGKAHMRVQADPELTGGVAIHDPEGHSRLSNTLDLRMHKVENEARRLCRQMLFGKEG